MTHQELRDYIVSLPGARQADLFGEDTEVYIVGPDDDTNKMFALIAKDSQPVRLSLRCDPQLARLLRDKYETVLPGHNLNKKYWNTIICSGQLSRDEVFDLVRLSYQLTSGKEAV